MRRGVSWIATAILHRASLFFLNHFMTKLPRKNSSEGFFGRGGLISCGLFCFAVCSTSAVGDVKLPAIFSDHMVFQQDSSLPIWGWAAAGESITVRIAGQQQTATADQDGNWALKLGKLQAGTIQTLTVMGRNTITIQDVLIGEVWVCSGQSNMEFRLKRARNAAEEIAAATYPQIRSFTVPRSAQPSPVADVKAKWVVCSPSAAAEFSAVGYFFGRELHKALQTPVGLISVSVGGTPAEAWTSAEGLDADPELKEVKEKQIAKMINYPTAPGAELKQTATYLYNGMVHPLIPYAIRGVIWYQGETDAWKAFQYRKLLPALIQDWRARWGKGDFPFYIVQLANNGAALPEPKASVWAELREAQSITTANVPNTGLAVAIDIGESDDIHPKNKQDVGHRLALTALAKTYGQKLEYSGPHYESQTLEGSSIRLTFSQAEEMIARGGPLRQFAIAGEDQKFVWAEARIDGHSVVVSSPLVSKPVAVRYAWANNPEGANLYNGAGLPASPFRTDDWPGITATAK
jgi:sialate O-acetylesterase